MNILLLLTVLCGPLWAQQQPAAPAPAPVTPAAPAAQSPVTSAVPSPVPSDDRWLTGSLDLGYRWVTGVGGSVNTYRSIVDLGSGPKLLGTDFTITDPKHRFFDRIDVRAYNWGDDPYSTFHLGAKKVKIYDFSVDYRNIAYYNNLPAFADPLLATAGVILSEQSLDTRQRFSSFQFDVLPGNWIVPYIAYERDADTGTGVATFVSGGNEYPVVNRARNSTNNYRGGIRIDFSRLHLTLEQGGTTFRDDEQLNQNSGQIGFGNFTAPLLGQTLDLTGLGEAYGVRGNSIYSKALLTANAASWVDLYGQFLYSQPQSNVNFQQVDTGNQVLLNQLLFYTGEQSIVSAESKLPHTSASFGAEIRPFRRLHILPSWLTDRMHTSGSNLARQNLMTAAGSLPIDTLLGSALVTNYDQAEIGLMFDLTSKITLRSGYRYVWGNASDVILPISGLAGLDQGKIRRNVALAGFAWRPFHKLSINADFEDGSSGGSYFRTSLYNYRKMRVRGRYQVLQTLSISANASLLNNQNPTTGINYDFLAHQESVSFLYMPSGGRYGDFQGGYTRSTLHSDLGYFDPEFLIPERSFYRDNSHTVTALFDTNIPVYSGVKARLSFGGSLVISSGSNPTRLYQPVGKLSVPFHRNVAWVTEWRYYGFDQIFYIYQGFRSQMVTTGVRLTR